MVSLQRKKNNCKKRSGGNRSACLVLGRGKQGLKSCSTKGKVATDGAGKTADFCGFRSPAIRCLMQLIAVMKVQDRNLSEKSDRKLIHVRCFQISWVWYNVVKEWWMRCWGDEWPASKSHGGMRKVSRGWTERKRRKRFEIVDHFRSIWKILQLINCLWVPKRQQTTWICQEQIISN